jgi:cobalt/nickel transport system permease protein
MLDLFSDIFAYRDHSWTRMDPRGKLVLSLAAILGVILSTRMVFPLAVFAFCLGAMLCLRLPARLVLARLAAPLGIVVVLILLQSLFFGRTKVFSFSLLGIEWVLKQEGGWRGLLMGSKVLGAVSVMLLLSLVTPAHKIFHALLWFRIPRGWVEIAMLMYRYVFSLLDDTADVAAAQKVRLGYRGIKRSLSSCGALAGAVIIRSLDQATHTREAMIIRGYKGSIPFGPMPAMGWMDRLRIAGFSALLAAVYLFLEWGLF